MGLTRHVSVLLEEVVGLLGGCAVVVDGTLGGGGHARALLEAGVGRLVGMDWDAAALKRCGFLVEKFGPRVELIHAGYDRIGEVLNGRLVEGILLDLGFSSDQLDDAKRGLSYHAEGPLDMRLDSRVGRTAADLLARADERELADIFYHYGEEPKARPLARAIVRARKGAPLLTTFDLLRVVEEVYPHRPGLKRGHPAARVFQALRIAVNDEMEVLARALPAAARCLAVGGKLVVITFQPLEERLVKQVFRELCVDTLDEVGRVVGKAPFKMGKKIMPTAREIEVNPRARSAILRVLERVA